MSKVNKVNFVANKLPSFGYVTAMTAGNVYYIMED